MNQICSGLAKAVDLYDEWYDGIIEGIQKRFDRFCYRVEEFINKVIKMALRSVKGLTKVCGKVTNEQGNRS